MATADSSLPEGAFTCSLHKTKNQQTKPAQTPPSWVIVQHKLHERRFMPVGSADPIHARRLSRPLVGGAEVELFVDLVRDLGLATTP